VSSASAPQTAPSTARPLPKSLSGYAIFPISMNSSAATVNESAWGAKKRARGADSSQVPTPLSPHNTSERTTAWHESLGDTDECGARPSKRMMRQVELLQSVSSEDAAKRGTTPSRTGGSVVPNTTSASTTSASATSGTASMFVLDTEPASAFSTGSHCALRGGADACTPLARGGPTNATCEALHVRTAARPPARRAVPAPSRSQTDDISRTMFNARGKIASDLDASNASCMQQVEDDNRTQAQAAPLTPRPQISVDFDPMDERHKLMHDFGRAKASSPECKLPRSVTPQAVDEALHEQDEEEEEEHDEWDAEGQPQQNAHEEAAEELDHSMPTLQYQTLMGTHDRAASSTGVHYFEMLIEQPSALMLVGVARPKLRNEFNSRHHQASQMTAAKQPAGKSTIASTTAGTSSYGSAATGAGTGAGAGVRPSTPVANTSRSAAQQEQSPLKAFRSQHAFQLHTATGDRWHAGRPCAPSPTLEPEPGPAVPTSISAAPVRRCLGMSSSSGQGSRQLGGMTAKELEMLDEAGLLAEPEPRFQKGDRVGVLVEIDANTPGTSKCGYEAEGVEAKRARVSFTRNGRTLRKVGAFEDIAVEDGFVPVVDVALGGRVRFVDWKHFV